MNVARRGPPAVHSTPPGRLRPPPPTSAPTPLPVPGHREDMRFPLPSSIRVHGLPGVVVAVLLAALLSLVRPAGALGQPMDPVPVGVWPLQPQPQVVRAFDPPDTPFGSGHRGVDLAGSVGQPVLAALPGRVTFASPLAGRGVVVVDHGSTRTTYEPVAAAVSVGQSVVGGERIGSLELQGSHCFPRACLHWGWRRGATYLDPLLLVGGGPIRLLPLWRDQPVGAARSATPSPPFARLVGRLLGLGTDAPPVGSRSPPSGPQPTPVATRSFAMRPLLL